MKSLRPTARDLEACFYVSLLLLCFMVGGCSTAQPTNEIGFSNDSVYLTKTWEWTLWSSEE